MTKINKQVLFLLKKSLIENLLPDNLIGNLMILRFLINLLNLVCFVSLLKKDVLIIKIIKN